MRLPLKEKILFATGGFGENVTFQAVSAWLLFYWSAFLPIGLLGILLGVGRLIEAFDDPLIGHLSDRTRSRWGRRFPYIFLGAPLLALSFFLLWLPVANAIYFFLVLQFFFLMYTIVSAPYEGILPEIAKTSVDRVSTSGWRVLFGVLGAGVGLVGSGILITFSSFQTMGVVLGAAALISFWVAILGIRKKLTLSAQQSKMNLYKALLATLKNKQFLVFSLALILFSMGLNLLTALLPFYVKVILGQHEGTVAIFTGLVLISMLLALPLQTRLAQKFGKKALYGYSMLILAILFLPLFIVGSFWQLMALVVLIGLALSGQFVFPNAILADVIDYDAIKTGLRREAMYYGMQNTLQKFSFALSSVIFGTTLSVFGATIDQPLGLRLIGPIAGLTTLVGFLIFVKWYKLPDEVKTNVKSV